MHMYSLQRSEWSQSMRAAIPRRVVYVLRIVYDLGQTHVWEVAGQVY